MTSVEHNKLINEAYKLALDGARITPPFLQERLGIEDENIAMAVIKVLENHGKIIYVDLEGARFWLDTSKLKPNFGMPNDPEEDEKLIELIGSAKRGEIPVFTAIVDINKIKPYCDYKPAKESFDKTKEYLRKNIEKHDPPLLHVYQDGENLIMSDDYNAYFMYLEEGFKKVSCIIFGETSIEGIQNKELVNYN